MRRLLLSWLLFTPSVALGADLGLGVLLESGYDLADPAAQDHTSFGLISGLALPVRIGFTDQVSLRVTPRFSFASGRDRINWEVPIDGDNIGFYSEDQRAFLAGASLIVGPEVSLPVNDSLAVIFGAAAGVGWVGTYHSLTESAQVLFDLEVNDLSNVSNLDPYTSQFVISTDLFAGVKLGLSDTLSLCVEMGYAPAYVAESALLKSVEELNARRAAYGWNPLRAGVGVEFSL